MRKSNPLGALFFIVGLPMLLMQKVFETVNPKDFFSFLAGLIGIFILYRVLIYKTRKNGLLKKYKNPEVVRRILKGSFWQGQSSEQLIDALGEAKNIDRKILKSKCREVWKYRRTGKNRYSLRIFLEDGFVVGWEEK